MGPGTGDAAATDERGSNGDGVAPSVGVGIGEHQRLAQRQVGGAAEIGERGVGVVRVELVVEGGDDEACAGLLLEGAEIGEPAPSKFKSRAKPRASVVMMSV